jgi:hypothetical protein
MLLDAQHLHHLNTPIDTIRWLIRPLDDMYTYGVTADKYYESIPERVINVGSITIIWDVPVITGRTILVN